MSFSSTSILISDLMSGSDFGSDSDSGSDMAHFSTSAWANIINGMAPTKYMTAVTINTILHSSIVAF